MHPTVAITRRKDSDMARITPVAVDEATTSDELEALDELSAAWGGVPQLGRVIARSLPLTRGLLAFNAALHRGRFTGARAEQLAVAVAHENRCRYCLAAHTAAGRALGLTEQDLADARVGHAADPKVSAALAFSQQVVRARGQVTARDLAAVRTAGWSDADLVEIVGHVVATTLTSYLHHLSHVPVDFTPVDFADALAEAG